MLQFVTGNENKVRQLRMFFDQPVQRVTLDLTEIQSLDAIAIVRAKAYEAHKLIGGTVLIEDTSLTFPALGKLPGPLIKWFLHELGNEGLCRLLDGKDRTAIASVVYGLFDGKHFHTFTGETYGTIAQHPQGKENFGWNSTFIPDGYEKSWAQMDDLELSHSAMRKVALQKLSAHLNNR